MRTVFAFVVVILAVLWFIASRPSPINPQFLDPAFAELREPFRRVVAIRTVQGRTVGVEITDADGRFRKFAIPCDLTALGGTPAVFVGTWEWAPDTSARRAAHPETMRAALVSVLARYGRGHPQVDAALGELTGSLADRYRYALHQWRGHYDP